MSSAPLFAVTPEVLRQLLAAATRTAIQSNWQVLSVPAANQVVAGLVNPAAATPFLTASAPAWYQNAVVEFISGRLGGIEPDSDGQPSTTGRVTVPIASVTSTLNAEGPPTTTITFKDNLPGTPAAGDRFVIYYAQVGSFTLDANITNAEIDANITNSEIDANITNTTLTVEQASGTTFNVGTVGSITETVQGNVTNTMVPSSQTVYLGRVTFSVSNLASGAIITAAVNANYPSAFGLMDGLIIVAESTIGNQSFPYTIGISDVATNLSSPFQGFTTPGFSVAYSAQSEGTSGASYSNASYRALFAAPVETGRATIKFTNATSGTIASDTITFDTFVVKAQLSNPTSAPANIQPGQGAFDTLVTQSNASGSIDQGATLIPSGNAIKRLNFGGATLVVNVPANESGSAFLNLYLGSVLLASITAGGTGGGSGAQFTATLPAQTFDWGAGVSNPGLTVTTGVNSGTILASSNWSVALGNAVEAANTPPSLVGVVV